ncbi:hypothetical protein GH733_003305 [Mirounga leonina]|nr:hypothetical protein GH733_003305 [Mirounga leonina]
MRMSVQSPVAHGVAIQINWHLLRAATSVPFPQNTPCMRTHTHTHTHRAITDENLASFENCSAPRLILIAQVAVSGNIITPGPCGKEGISLLVNHESTQCQELTPATC